MEGAAKPGCACNGRPHLASPGTPPAPSWTLESVRETYSCAKLGAQFCSPAFRLFALLFELPEFFCPAWVEQQIVPDLVEIQRFRVRPVYRLGYFLF